jgi:hypothetical protein
MGSLNPDWVETLMGFPPGWTRIDGLQAPTSSSISASRRASRTNGESDGNG